MCGSDLKQAVLPSARQVHRSAIVMDPECQVNADNVNREIHYICLYNPVHTFKESELHDMGLLLTSYTYTCPAEQHLIVVVIYS